MWPCTEVPFDSWGCLKKNRTELLCKCRPQMLQNTQRDAAHVGYNGLFLVFFLDRHSWDGSVRVPRNVHRPISEGTPCTGFPCVAAEWRCCWKHFALLLFVTFQEWDCLACPVLYLPSIHVYLIEQRSSGALWWSERGVGTGEIKLTLGPWLLSWKSHKS